jgi:hypothetical protein
MRRYPIALVISSWSDSSYHSPRNCIFGLLLAVKPDLMSVPIFSFDVL